MVPRKASHTQVDKLTRKATELAPSRAPWAQESHPKLQNLVTRINGPVARWLAEEIGFEDTDLIDVMAASLWYC